MSVLWKVSHQLQMGHHQAMHVPAGLGGSVLALLAALTGCALSVGLMPSCLRFQAASSTVETAALDLIFQFCAEVQ